ncbi:MAG: hypothetical protein M3299_01465 [Thermoproteota archaeon]|nr:hypothetical protein [Thermoproteota archaeon]
MDGVGAAEGDDDNDGDTNVSQHDSNQDRGNRNVDRQGNVQRQSGQIRNDDGSGGGGSTCPGCGSG